MYQNNGYSDNYALPFDPNTDILKKQDKIKRRKELKKHTTKIGLSMLIYIAASFVIMFLLMIVAMLTGTISSSNSDYISGFPPVFYYLLSGAISLGAAITASMVIFGTTHTKIDSVLKFKKVSIKKLSALIVVTLGFVFVCNLILTLLNANLSLFGYNNELPDTAIGTNYIDYILYFFTVAIIPPLAEEFLFRGAILGSLRKYGDGFAVLISSLFFGLAHGNFVQMPVTFLSGLLMGMLVIYTNSIIPSMILHFLNNAFSVVFDILSRNIGIEISNLIYYIFMGVICILAVFALIYLIKSDSSFPALEKSQSTLSLKEKVIYTFTSTGVILMVLFDLSSSINLPSLIVSAMVS